MSFSTRARLLHRSAALLAAAALAVTAASAAGASTDELAGQGRLDTFAGWDGTTSVFQFGHPDTTTYGQTFVAPDRKTDLRWFEFHLASYAGSGSLPVRGEVYAWDGDSASGEALWSGKSQVLELDEDDPGFDAMRFKIKGGVDLEPGASYVMFFSISKDYEAATPGVGAQIAARPSDEIPGGHVVFLNDGGFEEVWTVATWYGFDTWDFALRARFR